MDRKYLALNSALLFWLLALVAWCSGAFFLTWLFAAFSLLSFGLSLLLNQVKIMFKKSKTTETAKSELILPPVPAIEKEPTVPEKHGTTVIASDVRFEGNVVSGGHVYVHGTLIGNIDAKESLIKIMRGGQVEGNITCRELIVDGKVIGLCSGDIIEICENGQVTGTLAYRTLAVKKGGQFSGQAEVLPAVAEKTNVVGLMKESTPDALDLIPLQKL
jgi:cytoskeletal protein CcmA (bactofilin family)